MRGIYVLAAAGDDEALYRIGTDGVAHVVRGLDQPDSGAPFEVHDATLSAGPHPTACLLWSAQHDRRVLCYPFGSSKGTPVAAADPARDSQPDEIGAIAISSDGTRFAWVDVPQDQAQPEHVRTGTLGRSGLVTGRVVSVEDTECANYVVSLAWRGDGLVLECNGENDAAGGYASLPVHGKGAYLDEHHPDPYNEYRGQLSVQGSSAIGIENEYCEITCEDGKPSAPFRAVRWDLTTGRVRDVLVTPAPGRSVVAVWGGPDGLVYETEGTNDRRLYVRMPGQRVGTRVTGVKEIDTAQP